MNNLLSYCGLTDARMRASEKDLPVLNSIENWHFADCYQTPMVVTYILDGFCNHELFDNLDK